MTEKDYKFRAIRVKGKVHERFTKMRKDAGMQATEYTQYLLNLGAAYPPTLDYTYYWQELKDNDND